MQNRYSAAGGPSARPAKKIWLTLTRYRRSILATMMLLAVLLAGTTGFMLGNGKPASAVSSDIDNDYVAAFANQLAAENDLCAQIEQLNIQEQLEAEKVKAADLEQAMDAQREEMDNLESTILNALMSNLVEQSVSRSRKTLTAYREEAVNLIELSTKLDKFLKTDSAGEIDLSSYETEIDRRLRYLPTIKPISGNFRNGSYGYRIHPVHRYRHFHPAVDVGAPTGTRIRAAAAGYVTISKFSGAAGNYITINHGNGFTTTYMHCSKLLARVGQFVDKGEIIAHVGNTGTSTSPHLHYEMRFNGEPVNPASMILE